MIFVKSVFLLKISGLILSNTDLGELIYLFFKKKKIVTKKLKMELYSSKLGIIAILTTYYYLSHPKYSLLKNLQIVKWSCWINNKFKVLPRLTGHFK